MTTIENDSLIDSLSKNLRQMIFPTTLEDFTSQDIMDQIIDLNSLNEFQTQSTEF